MPPPRYETPGLYELMQAIRAELIDRMDKHGRELSALHARLSEHDEKDQLVENRVFKIEIQREGERRNAAKLQAIMTAAGLAIVEVVKNTWTHYHP